MSHSVGVASDKAFSSVLYKVLGETLTLSNMAHKLNPMISVGRNFLSVPFFKNPFF